MVLGVATAAQGEYEAGDRESAPGTFDGYRGNQGIRTNPITTPGVAYVHPNQVDFADGPSDFLAVGTYKGEGTSGGSPDCVDDYDGRWTVYVDGILFGDYFCVSQPSDVLDAGDNPSFSIVYGFCPLALENRWLLSFNGVLWECYEGINPYVRRVVSGLETTNTTTDYNIDVKYTEMEVNRSGNIDWIPMRPERLSVGCCYEYDDVSLTAFNVYKVPLD